MVNLQEILVITTIPWAVYIGQVLGGSLLFYNEKYRKILLDMFTINKFAAAYNRFFFAKTDIELIKLQGFLSLAFSLFFIWILSAFPLSNDYSKLIYTIIIAMNLGLIYLYHKKTVRVGDKALQNNIDKYNFFAIGGVYVHMPPPIIRKILFSITIFVHVFVIFRVLFH
jgi:ABC-type transport system involved in cytochrome c biogenesis permease subunit